MSSEFPLTPEQIAQATMRRMDCVDCHNRPSHIFRPPDRAVEKAIDSGKLDRRLPYLKREAVRLLVQDYASEQEAHAAILAGLSKFYEQAYPELAHDQRAVIRQATEELQRIFSRNMFPEMKTDWRAHPDHVGHLNSEGCFRCHDGLHKSSEGEVITKDCNACHTILFQGPPEAMTTSVLKEQPFQHPVDLGTDVTKLRCSDCHTGTSGL